MERAYNARVTPPHGYVVAPWVRDLGRTRVEEREHRFLNRARELAATLGDPEAAYTALRSDHVTKAHVARAVKASMPRERKVVTPQTLVLARIMRQRATSAAVVGEARRRQCLAAAFAGKLAIIDGKVVRS